MIASSALLRFALEYLGSLVSSLRFALGRFPVPWLAHFVILSLRFAWLARSLSFALGDLGSLHFGFMYLGSLGDLGSRVSSLHLFLKRLPVPWLAHFVILSLRFAWLARSLSFALGDLGSLHFGFMYLGSLGGLGSRVSSLRLFLKRLPVPWLAHFVILSLRFAWLARSLSFALGDLGSLHFGFMYLGSLGDLGSRVSSLRLFLKRLPVPWLAHFVILSLRFAWLARSLSFALGDLGSLHFGFMYLGSLGGLGSRVSSLRLFLKRLPVPWLAHFVILSLRFAWLARSLA